MLVKPRLFIITGLFGLLAGGKVSFAAFSLEDCLARVHQGSVQIAQSSVNEARAREALREIESLRLPALVGQANLLKSYDPIQQSYDANKLVLRVEQNAFPFLGPVWAQASQRGLDSEVASLSRLESEQDVRFLVKQLYFWILRDRESIDRIRVIESELRKVLATVLPRFNFGTVHSFDTVKIKSSTYDLVRTRTLLESQLIGEESQLSQIIAEPIGNLAALAPIKSLPALPGREVVRQSALAANPTLLSADRQIDAARQSVRAAQYARIPSLSAAYEYGAYGQVMNQLNRGWIATAQLRLTIFDWGLVSSQIRQAEAQTLLSEKRRLVELQKNETDIEQTLALARAHFEDQGNLNGMLGEVRHTALSAKERYRHAGVSIIELTDSVNLWLQTSINERVAYYSYLTDLAKLERLSGERIRMTYVR